MKHEQRSWVKLFIRRKNEWQCSFGHEGLSTYYENDLRYNLEDARAHVRELQEEFPETTFQICMETTVEVVIDTIESGLSLQPKWKDCERCAGTGEVYEGSLDSMICPDCDGLGGHHYFD